MSERLKPCPFCGGEAKAFFCEESGTYDVQCQQCGALPFLGRKRGPGRFKSMDDVIAAWNRRAGRTCRMEAFLLGEFFTGRKHVTDTELSDEEIDKVLLELRDDTVIRCSACHFSVLYGADVTYTQTDDGAWSVDAVRSQINYCPHCGARVEVRR